MLYNLRIYVALGNENIWYLFMYYLRFMFTIKYTLNTLFTILILNLSSL